MAVPQLQSTGWPATSRGDIFAPEALVRTLTLGSRLENGLAGTLLEVFFCIEGLF